MVTSEWHVQPSEFERLPYYQVQWIFDDFEELMKMRTTSNDIQTTSDGNVTNHMLTAQNMATKLQGNAIKGLKMPPMPKMPKP
jgi:hypothetical protein